MDPGLLEDALADAARRSRLPKAVVLVHLYGQTANLDAIGAACARYGVPLVEDAAEALGASYRGRAPGTFGVAGIFSFNGNKIVTTSGGGMLVTEDAALAAHVRKLATQAREPAPHYEHSEIGYNYRLSNVLAAIGRGQIRLLEDRVSARRRIFEGYARDLRDLPGIGFMPEADWGRATRWLTVMTVDPAACGADREVIRLALEAENIEARPVWKPMHLQPVFRDAEVWGGDMARGVFERGLCLPSGSSLAEADRQRVVAVIRGLAR
jgi:dTDP-4-amino-4,6-dideoxygalactose transaminase